MLSKTIFQATRPAFQSFAAQRSMASFTKAPVRVSVTGASGNISYAVAFRLARYESIVYLNHCVVASSLERTNLSSCT